MPHNAPDKAGSPSSNLTPGDFRKIAHRLPRPSQAAAINMGASGTHGTPSSNKVDIHGLSRLGKLIFRQTETLQDYVADFPAIAYLIDGRKTVGTRPDAPPGETMIPGQILLIPAGLPLTVVNYPDLETGLYSALVLEFSPDLIMRFIAAYPEIRDITAAAAAPQKLVIAPKQPLLRSVLAVMSLLTAPTSQHDRIIIRHRLMEVLLLLAQHGQAGPLLLLATTSTIEDRLLALFRLSPARKWQKPQVARHLGISPSSIDRHLKQAGTSFRQLLEGERMAHAATLLAQIHTKQPTTPAPTGVDRSTPHQKIPNIRVVAPSAPPITIADIAFQCGYQSQSAFGRAFLRHFGHSPMQLVQNMV
ncbi:AraC family transcriptional regulator [Thalassospira sp. MCCC 1A01428]|uniref:helix-turn-helix transcriptional regulator n=1 Tax=Thalassospira sp. MCCC 1A01428 TaxID=1470575 RepID=UPI000A1E2F9D|nr:AraC family transcriptional regulator [Thalassospira sp. MCCC 1A01428]OSQ42721.1 hypothetical protein THS27_13265 [Thalassospira sp. MCCC 1A01428]